MPIDKLILLPGTDGSGLYFGAFLTTLGNPAAVRILNYPTDIALDYNGLREVLKGKLPTDSAYILVAESFSGPPAIQLAREAGNPPSALVLVSTFATRPSSAGSRL